MLGGIVPSEYVQFGCAYIAPTGWTNFDSSPTLRLERLPLVGRLININPRRFPANVLFGDVVKGLPTASGTATGVYASHVLEHLALDDFRRALEEVFRILAPGGVFRLVVPDLASRAEHYLTSAGRGNAEANGEFMRLTHLGNDRIPKSFSGKVRFAFANSHHRWMWDYPGMAHALADAGFDRIRRASFNDSDDPAFFLVEERSRFYWSPRGDADVEVPECAVEARRPN
jgi:SAM-dependent methyltransferase